MRTEMFLLRSNLLHKRRSHCDITLGAFFNLLFSTYDLVQEVLVAVRLSSLDNSPNTFFVSVMHLIFVMAVLLYSHTK